MPNIGGNLGHGRQEDAHEFMRFLLNHCTASLITCYRVSIYRFFMDTANIFHVNTSNLSFNLLLQYCRFAIDTMQSVCLDEFGGEKAVHPSSQETTLIQHIFGGHLQSQVGTLSHIHKFVFVVVLLHSDAVKMLFAILDKYKYMLYWFPLQNF